MSLIVSKRVSLRESKLQTKIPSHSGAFGPMRPTEVHPPSKDEGLKDNEHP